MKKYSITFSFMFVLIYSLMAVEGDEKNVNEKFKFIKDIYSESWALIIGINNYQNVAQLDYAVNDAIAVREMLIDKYAFKADNIQLITDEEATKDNIIKGFSDILTQAKEKDRVVVFYAGHGETYKLPSGGDMGYLIPVDGNLDNLYLSSIAMKSVYDIADMSYAKHILYLVDACYGGLTLASTRGLKKDTTPEYIQKMTKERGRQVITAGGKGEQVLEKAEWGHSAFTKSLLNGLGEGYADENLDGIITADELGSFIKNRVIVDVDGAHTPQKGRIGSDMGEFVFISENLVEQVASANISDNRLDDIQNQMAAQQEQMAQLTELLLAQTQNQQVSKTQEVVPVDNYPSPVPTRKKSKKSFNMKTASTLAWVFPGMGHYYTGRTGKGIFFTALEASSLTGVAVFSSEYLSKQDEYATAQKAYDLFAQNVRDGGEWSVEERDLVLSNRQEAFDFQNQALQKMAGAGTAAVAVWLWNIWDVKKTASNHSSSLPVSFGVNRQGQVTFTIKF